MFQPTRTNRFINSIPMQTYLRELKVALNEFFIHNNTNSFNKIAGILSNTSTMLQLSSLCVLQVNCGQENGIAFKKWIRDILVIIAKKTRKRKNRLWTLQFYSNFDIFFNFLSFFSIFAGFEFPTKKLTSDDEKDVWTDFLLTFWALSLLVRSRQSSHIINLS